MNIPLVKVPTFTMILPHSKKEIKFRPYVVKEEKLLIMADDSKDIETTLNIIGDIVKNCTFNAIDIETDAMFDVQHAFLQIRGKSSGEAFEIYLVCGNCNHKTPVLLNVNDFKLKTTPGHTNTIKLPENYSVEMRYPTFKHFMKLYESEDENKVYDVVAECIKTISTVEETFENTKDNIKDIREFIDNLTPDQFEQFENFFITMPLLQHSLDYTCSSCNTLNNVLIDGINNFFE